MNDTPRVEEDRHRKRGTRVDAASPARHITRLMEVMEGGE